MTRLILVQSFFSSTEYGEFKSKHKVGFFDMVKTPSMACEITMQVNIKLHYRMSWLFNG